MALVEQYLAAFLAPETNLRLNSATQLLHKQPRVSAKILYTAYKPQVQGARAQNSVLHLLSYVAVLNFVMRTTKINYNK